MARNFETVFRIAGQIASSFPNSIRSASSALDNLHNRASAARDSLAGLDRAARAGAVASMAVLAGMGVAANEAIKFESAFADVKKVVNGTPAELKALNSEILEMSTRLPMAANDISKIIAAGGQSGIARSELTRFAESAVKMGVAFDITAEEAGQAMAEMRAAFKFTQPEVEALGNQINYLSNNSTQSAKKITEVVQRVGSIGEIAGFAASDLAAMSATLTAIEPEVAATGIKNMTLALVKGESATKSQKEAWKKLGIDYKAVSKGMVTDAQGTMVKVIESLGGIKDAERLATINDLFGSEGLAVLGQMYNNVDKLKVNLKDLGDATKYGTSMWDEYNARAATTENGIQLAKNQINVMAITIGNQLLPTINELLKSFAGVMSSAQKWAKENPELVSTLTKAAAVAALIVGGVSALALGIIALIGPFILAKSAVMGVVGVVLKLFSGLRYLSTAIPWIITIAKWMASGLWSKAIALIKMLGTAFMGLGRVFLMNPIGLAIIAIIVAIGLLYYNWDTVSKFLVSSWEWIKSAWSSSMAAITGLVSTVWTSIKAFFTSGIANIIATIVNFSPVGLFYQAFTAVMSYFGIDLPAKFTDFGKMMIQGLINGIGSMIGAVVDKAKAIASAVTNTVKGAFQINSPSRLFEQFGVYNMQGLANGMDSSAGLPQRAASSAAYGSIPSMPSSNSSLAPTGGGGSVLQLTQYITVGSGDAAEQAKQGAASGAQDMLTAYKEMKALEARLSF